MTASDLDPTFEQPRGAGLRRWIGAGAGIAGFALVLSGDWIFPGLDGPQRRLAAVMILAVCGWISEALPLAMTGILATALALALGTGSGSRAALAYVDPLIALFFGAFLMARAMQKQALDQAMARQVLGSRWVAGSPLRTLAAIGLVVGAISAFISNTAAAAMALPIVSALAAEPVADPKLEASRRRFQTGALLMLAFGASVGGLISPVGTPPNAIGVGMIRDRVGISISFFGWMAFGLPIALMVGTVLMVILWQLFGKGMYSLRHIPPAAPADAGVRRSRWVVFGCFLACVIGWLAPDLASLIGGKTAGWAQALLPSAVPPLLAAAAMFVWPRARLLEARDLKKIDWGTLALFGSGLALGGLMFETGLAQVLGRSMGRWMGVETVWGLTALATGIAIVLSEACSNTASANMVIPLAIGFAHAAGVPALPPALGAALGASFGFMLPVSTPPNAIVYGTRRVPLVDMMRAGVALDVIGFIAIVGGLRVLCPLLGLV